MKITEEGWATIEGDTHIGKWVEESRRLDFDQNALPQMLPYIDPGKLTLDIGANIGCYAYAFIQKGGVVACFEPNLLAFECLKHNIGNSQNSWLKQVAISDKVESYEVYSDNENAGMCYIKTEPTATYTMTVDMLNCESCGFIKIDVEGYELHVLRGGEKTIDKFKPVIVIEINDHTLKRTNTTREEIFQWLTDHGYTYRNIYAEQGLTDDQLDIICFPT